MIGSGQIRTQRKRFVHWLKEREKKNADYNSQSSKHFHDRVKKYFKWTNQWPSSDPLMESYHLTVAELVW